MNFIKHVFYLIVKDILIVFTSYTLCFWFKKSIRGITVATGNIFDTQTKSLVKKLNTLVSIGRIKKVNIYNALILFSCNKISSYNTDNTIVANTKRFTIY